MKPKDNLSWREAFKQAWLARFILWLKGKYRLRGGRVVVGLFSWAYIKITYPLEYIYHNIINGGTI